MTTKQKKILATIGIILLIILAVGILVIVPRIAQIRRLVAPTAPESVPAAAEWIGGAACNVSFTVKAPITCVEGLSDSFEAATIDTAKWEVSENPPNVRVVSAEERGLLRVVVVGGENNRSGGVTSFNTVKGDFVADVEVRRVNSDNKNLGVARFAVSNRNGNNNVRIERQGDTAGAQKISVTGVKDGAAMEAATANIASASATTTLRIERVGKMAKISFKEGAGAFTLVKQYDDWFQGEVEMRLRGVSSGTQTPNVTVRFDSFVLACASVITPTPTEVVTPTPTPTSVLTPTPTPTTTPLSCNQGCDTNSTCATGLSCDTTTGTCRNASCATETDCTCGTGFLPTPTTATQAAVPTPTTPPAELPEAGIGLPTLGALGGGIVMILLGILLAL